jgi:hypothetical protein
MPINPTYPGVYIEEIPSGVRTITGVATSITAFIGRALRGPVDFPIRIQSFADFERAFGGLWVESTLGYAVRQFFQHGGTDALIVRVHNLAMAATITLPTEGANTIVLEAANPGLWSNRLRAIVDFETRDETDTTLFNLTIVEGETEVVGSEVVQQEQFRNLSTDPNSSRYYANVIDEESLLVRVQTAGPDGDRPDDNAGAAVASDGTGNDGNPIDDNQVTNPVLETNREGLYALEAADLFNLLCIPPFSFADGDNVLEDAWGRAAVYCVNRRAMLLIDASDDTDTIAEAIAAVNDTRTAVGNDAARNAAMYFPRLQMADPLRENRTATFAPCGAVAGIIARTDAQRGVWKAPAGLEASFSGVRAFAYKMTDGENGQLNPLGLNCLRTFPVTGNVVWGARTLAGADRLASEWKYLPVRRLALYLEESLYRGTQWVVFEPNDEPLWAQIRLNVGAFMQNLFRQGAFQGRSPREAYFVRCDSTTTTQNDIDRGIVNIAVGFAPLKPAEFVIIQIQQMAGQIEV